MTAITGWQLQTDKARYMIVENYNPEKWECGYEYRMVNITGGILIDERVAVSLDNSNALGRIIELLEKIEEVKVFFIYDINGQEHLS